LPKPGIWLGHFDPSLAIRAVVRLDQRRFVKLAVAMHESIHYQFSDGR
jgi:hypothetical protein